jgi:2-polyprenyl-3-methyl-5-hydroxy-6-metoxy-1,4-benzoquinol methylase
MLEQRAIAEELMDADDLPPETYAAVLHDLAQVNTLTLARRPTLRFLAQVQKRLATQQVNAIRATGAKARVAPVHLKILDVGFGDGDMLRAIARWAANRHLTVELVGIDLNPNSAPAARAATPADILIDYRTGDYADLAGQDWDVILSSLVVHHMTHEQLVAFLRFMAAEARAGWFINDLHRHSFAYMGYPLLAGMMRWHPIVRHDGRLSIARSYRPAEWPPILAEADIADACIERHFPFRLCVSKIL